MGDEKFTHLSDMISNIAGIGTWHLDLVTDSLWWSLTTKRIHEVDESYSPELETAIDFYVEEHRPVISRLIKNAIEHDSSFDVNLQIRTANNTVKWVRAIGYALRGEDGTALGLEGIFQDVDELMATKIVVEEYQFAVDSLSQVMVSKEFYDMEKVFSEALKIGVEYLDFELGIISFISGETYHVAQKYAKRKSFDVEVGAKFDFSKTYCSLVYYEDQELVIEKIGESKYQGHPAYQAFPCEAYIGIPLIVKGKRYGTLNFTSREPKLGKVTSLHRKFVKFLGTWVEMIIERHHLITEYARNFEVADSHRARFEAVFEDAPHAMMFGNTKREIISINRSFSDTFGYSPEEITGQLTKVLYNDEADFERDGSSRYNPKAVKNIAPYRKTFKRKNGEAFEVEVVGAPVRDSHGKLIGYLGMIKDLSSDIETEKLIERQNLELEKERALSFQNSKMAALGQMAGGVAHEINNPLTIIEGFSKNLLRKIEKNQKIDLEDVQKTIEKIISASERISKIVQGLKTFARDDSRDDQELVSVKEMVLETLSFCEQRFKNNGVDLFLNIENESLSFRGHAVQISQVILNLLNNAFDAISDEFDSVAPWIKLNIHEQNGFIVFRVQDSGRGIEDSIIKNLMEPFFTTKQVGRGTGLGLSISSSIVEKHGGRLKYELFEGQTSFVFSLKKELA